MTISKQKARETRYWLRLIKDSGTLKAVQVANLLDECNLILKILTAIVKTSKENSSPTVAELPNMIDIDVVELGKENTYRLWRLNSSIAVQSREV